MLPPPPPPKLSMLNDIATLSNESEKVREPADFYRDSRSSEEDYARISN